MLLVRRIFLVAGIYGLVVLLPMYFLADMMGRQDPPEITHREYYYGFIGVALAWQVLFLILATDPRRFRPMIIPAILEKLGYGLAVFTLFAGGHVTGMTLATGLVDVAFAALFAYAFVRIGREYH